MAAKLSTAIQDTMAADAFPNHEKPLLKHRKALLGQILGNRITKKELNEAYAPPTFNARPPNRGDRGNNYSNARPNNYSNRPANRGRGGRGGRGRPPQDQNNGQSSPSTSTQRP